MRPAEDRPTAQIRRRMHFDREQDHADREQTEAGPAAAITSDRRLNPQGSCAG